MRAIKQGDSMSYFPDDFILEKIIMKQYNFNYVRVIKERGNNKCTVL